MLKIQNLVHGDERDEEHAQRSFTSFNERDGTMLHKSSLFFACSTKRDVIVEHKFNVTSELASFKFCTSFFL